MAEYYRKNKQKYCEAALKRREKKNAERRERYKHDENYRNEIRVKVKSWQQKNPKKRKAQRLTQYGLSYGEFEELLEQADQKCEICGFSDTSSRGHFPLVDHCHKTGNVRGILCGRCNKAIGLLLDDPELASRAAKYLRRRRVNGVKVIDQCVNEDGGFASYNGDCCEVIRGIPDEFVGFSVFSPPFSSLYTYSNSERDMGNSRDYEQFRTHFKFLIRELYRVLKPGRLCSVHCMNLPTTKSHHGYIGIQDFRGDIIRDFEACGFIFHSEVCIWKDPVTAMQRTKAIGLLHKQLCKDSALSRQGIPDYVVTFRKPGDNPEPVAGKLDHFAGDRTQFTRSVGDESVAKVYDSTRLSIDIWQRYASPVWMDIDMGNTLQYTTARDEKDERHICPLQLDVIHRCLQLWSNPNDVVLSPFMGIGSEGYESIKLGRRFIGIELKPSYYRVAVKNLQAAAEAVRSTKLKLEFDEPEAVLIAASAGDDPEF